jgi:O-methyltransferase involved in polyketide biosynthesis
MEPDSTAVRVALWRAIHVQADPEPHVLDDEIGLRLADPENGWRDRGDMHPDGTRTFRASIVARSRFAEDLVAGQAARGVTQYVLLGAGLDTFVQRRPELAAALTVYEVDRPGPQAWKRRRVPDDFETDRSWWTKLATAGFDPGRRAGVADTGRAAVIELPDPNEQTGRRFAEDGARASGTPFLSFFSPAEILELARTSGFARVEHGSAAELNKRYFSGRTDGLRTSNGEELLVAWT